MTCPGESLVLWKPCGQSGALPQNLALFVNLSPAPAGNPEDLYARSMAHREADPLEEVLTWPTLTGRSWRRTPT